MSELDEIIERIEHWKKKGGIEEEDWVCDGPALYLIATEQREEINRLREALGDVVDAYQLAGDHCEMEQAIHQARAALAETEADT